MHSRRRSRARIIRARRSPFEFGWRQRECACAPYSANPAASAGPARRRTVNGLRAEWRRSELLWSARRRRILPRLQSNAFEKMSAPKNPPQRRRHYGKCSPLDRLPELVKTELRRRCQGDVPFREMRDWLAQEHRCRTTITSLSDWWRRQKMDGWSADPASPQSITHGSFEIIVTAPGASEVRVQVRSVPAA